MCICVPSSINGYEYHPLIANLFHQCVYSPIEVISFILGLGNIAFWLVAQFPQLIQNFMQGQVDALSPMFIIQWLLGDICNLIGCIFTKQYPTQLYTAIYYVFMDFLMMIQYTYYVFLKPIWNAKHLAAQKRRTPILDGDDTENGLLVGDYHAMGGTAEEKTTPSPVGDYGTMYASISILLFLSMIVKLSEAKNWLSMVSSIFGASPSENDSPLSAPGRNLLNVSICDATAELSEWEHILGIIAAWISGILYFTARIPQVWLNYKRRSVAGLSFPMFFCAVMGNLCYGLSVLLPGIPDWKRFAIEVFPYILGSLCTLSMSFVIVIQFFLYRWIPACGKRTKTVVAELPASPLASPKFSFKDKLPFFSTSTNPTNGGYAGFDDEEEDEYYYTTEHIQSGLPASSP